MKIAIVGKGETGKTTIAYELSKKYQKIFGVMAIDADASLNLSLKFNIIGKPISQISELINRAKIDDVLDGKCLPQNALLRAILRDLILKGHLKLCWCNRFLYLNFNFNSKNLFA